MSKGGKWPFMSLAERFNAQHEKHESCWPWIGSRDRHGYGQINKGSKPPRTLKAHRASYELFVGPIPEGMSVLHSCDNPPCVNPAHLHLGTNLDNVREMWARGRAHRMTSEGSNFAKLSVSDVLEIKSLLSSSDHSMDDIAARFGIHETSVRRIQTGRTWSRITRKEQA